MDYIKDGILQAFQLLITFDPEVYEIIGLSLYVSSVSLIIAALVGVPLGILTGLKTFPFKSLYQTVLYAFMGLPPVVVGLFVALMISRRGPLGSFQLMFTPTAMIVAQSVLVLPIVTGIVFGITKDKGQKIVDMGYTLGAKPLQQMVLIVKELKKTLVLALATGFGRCISEVGAVMLVGGNIKGHTRVMTTYIALNNSMGRYSTSLAMGFVLITIALVVNIWIHRLTEVER